LIIIFHYSQFSIFLFSPEIKIPRNLPSLSTVIYIINPLLHNLPSYFRSLKCSPLYFSTSVYIRCLDLGSKLREEFTTIQGHITCMWRHILTSICKPRYIARTYVSITFLQKLKLNDATLLRIWLK